MRVLILLPALLAGAAPLSAQTFQASPAELAAAPLVTVQISESLRSAPDEASLSIGVQSRSPTASAALKKNQLDMAKLIALLKANGVVERQIQTEGVSLNADYAYDRQPDGQGRQRLIGYIAGNTVRIKTRDIDGLPALLDKLATAGANNIYGPNFTIADPAPLRAEAKRRAMQRGLEEARDFARNAGFSNVALLSVQDSPSYRATDVIVVTGQRVSNIAAPPPPPPPAPERGGSIAPGQIETGLTLTLTYRMER